jgi:hypothetical protein
VTTRGVYSDLISGKHKSVRQAAAAAGLIHLPSGLQALKREWKRATLKERHAFVAWAKANAGIARRGTGRSIAHGDGRLTGPAKAFIQGWLLRNRVRPGQVMKAIGRKNYDYRLAQSMNSGTPLPKDVLDDLSSGMRRNGL